MLRFLTGHSGWLYGPIGLHIFTGPLSTGPLGRAWAVPRATMAAQARPSVSGRAGSDPVAVGLGRAKMPSRGLRDQL